MKRCMYCGQVNEDTNDTCTKCGNPLLDTPYTGDGGQIEDETDTELPEIEPVEDEVTAELSFDEPEPSMPEDTDPDTDVQRGQGYAARAQYAEDDYDYPPYGGQDYEYDAQADGDQQYGGQAYGYDDPQQYGREPEYEEEYDRRRVSMTPIMKKSRKRVKSFLFLLPTLLFTVHMVAQIVNIVIGNWQTNLSTVSNTLQKQFGSSSILTIMNTAIGFINGADKILFLGIALILLIPHILMMFGLWGMFLKTGRRRAAISTSGYSLVKAGLIIQFIMACLVLLAAIVLAVSFVVAAGASGSTMSLIVGVVLLLVVVILAVLVIMYHIQVIYSIGLVRRNVRIGEDEGRIPGFVIFCGILLCALSVVCMLPMAPDDYIGLAANGAYAGWLLFISLWAIVYRSTVKEQ